MRIANNIMAMNTHRAYTTNNDKIAASAEKLSSGYRINKAGDDAAGLAISEKMRAQIRGLNMAKRNSQDAISLIQTAEGALQEVHSMLQRMNELANQSATGTNEAFDREQIAKEFEQLKREVNDISEQTTFNNMKILDGSLSATGVFTNRSDYTSGIYTTFQEDTPKSLPGGIKDITYTPAIQASTGYTASFTIDFTGSKVASALTSNDSVTIGGKTIKFKTDLATTATPATLAAALNGVTLAIGGVTFTASNSGDKLIFTAGEKADVSKEALEGISLAWGGGLTGTPDKISASQPGKADILATEAKSKFRYDVNSVQSGDVLKIGNQVFTFWDKLNDKISDDLKTTYSNDANYIDLQSIKDATALAAKLSGGTKNTGDNKITTAPDGDYVIITYAGTAGSLNSNSNATSTGPFGTAGNQHVTINSIPGGANPANKANSTVKEGTVTFEIDMDKLKIGDTLWWDDGKGTKWPYTYKEGDTAAALRDAFHIAPEDFDGNSWSIKGTNKDEARISFKAADDFTNYDVMKIQIGALEGEQLSIKIAAMNTKGLALDNAEIYTQKSAGEAITSTRNAINMVSDQRARLGAMQNRMNHKINNLAVSAENLQAAESRIRDIDIAQEMTKHTQANILSQAATAMLAQANAAPQNVLSLLK